MTEFVRKCEALTTPRALIRRAQLYAPATILSPQHAVSMHLTIDFSRRKPIKERLEADRWNELSGAVEHGSTSDTYCVFRGLRPVANGELLERVATRSQR
jgi:hypothetical protein